MSPYRFRLPLPIFLFACAVVLTPSLGSSTIYVHQNRVTFQWEPAPGTVDHYNTYVSVDGQPFAPSAEVRANRLELQTQDRRRYVLQVQAEAPNGSVGPLSDPSDEIVVYLAGSPGDTDGDGMPDAWETAKGLNPYNPDDGLADADGDGLANAQEYAAGTDPTKADTDGDGVSDKAEVDRGQNPLDPSDNASMTIPIEEGKKEVCTTGAEVSYSFQPMVGDVDIFFDTYNLVLLDEVEILVNGCSLGFVQVSGQNAWSARQLVVLPDAYVNDGAQNTLTFRNLHNPGAGKRWCMRNVCLGIPLPANEAYGNMKNGDQSHVDRVLYQFEGRRGDVRIFYEVYDIDWPDGLQILLNGEFVSFVEVTADGKWSLERVVNLPDALVKDSGTNLLCFDATRNPPRAYAWGVRNVSLDPTLISLPSSREYGYIKNGNQEYADRARFSFKGRPGNVTLRYECYDVDNIGEVAITVNGRFVGYAPVTTNQKWSGPVTVTLSDAWVEDSGTNVVTFDNTRNPPKLFWWGVRNLSVY